MGVIHHHAVIANTWDDDVFESVRDWIDTNIDPKQKELIIYVRSLSNGRRSIILAPDGSKEGWSTSNKIDSVRDKLTSHLDTYQYEDGSSPIDYVEVGFGDRGQEVVRGNNEDKL